MFCSRDERYRNPIGAVRRGENVHFSITTTRKIGCSGIELILEKDASQPIILHLFWCGMNGHDKEWWECDFAPPETGLYFYTFKLHTAYGAARLNRGEGGKATVNGRDKWQLTVYAPEYETPDWILGGTMYQIFPDRFYRSDLRQDVPEGRIMHQEWSEDVVWQPDEDGVIRNNDFFGGDLKGIELKLPYLHKLGITCIYLNPIFAAYSNHRYDTSNYAQIDPLLGDEKAFSDLCAAAKELGIAIILDGVFSHTGSDSVYFNRYGRYEELGAFQSKDSPYFNWYRFERWPDKYDCWWGFETLPNVNETNPGFDAYINGADGIVRKWIRAGAAGWRLDVADELPDQFIDRLTAAAKQEKSDAIVLGEVWEDASSKMAYGQRRRYLLGKQLDSVMNYPFRNAILQYVKGGSQAHFHEVIETIAENYPPACLNALMNHIGTHDTERAITVLAGEPAGDRGRQWQSQHTLSAEEWEKGKQMLKLAAIIQYLLPGVPCVYYGDEAGMASYRDPFNRATYPWGREDMEILDWYVQLGKLRADNKDILREAGYRRVDSQGRVLAFRRKTELDGEKRGLVLYVNADPNAQHIVTEPCLTNATCMFGEDIRETKRIAPYGFALYRY